MDFDPPYYAVIFSSRRKPGDNGYAEAGERLQELVKSAPGYLGYESARGEDGFGISVAYFESQEAIANWRRQAEHIEAQRRGRADWYEYYNVRVAKVERAFGMKK